MFEALSLIPSTYRQILKEGGREGGRKRKREGEGGRER
jgi:hypothetical protein